MISGMSDLNRREFGVALAAFAAMAGAAAEGQAAAKVLGDQRVYRYDELTVKPGEHGFEGRKVVEGTLPTGEFVEIHESVLQPGQQPHLPHRHTHSEMILIREGSLEYENDGKAEPPAGPGDIIFTASMRLHGLKNVGTVPAKYFVVAVGVQKAG